MGAFKSMLLSMVESLPLIETEYEQYAVSIDDENGRVCYRPSKLDAYMALFGLNATDQFDTYDADLLDDCDINQACHNAGMLRGAYMGMNHAVMILKSEG